MEHCLKIFQLFPSILFSIYLTVSVSIAHAQNSADERSCTLYPSPWYEPYTGQYTLESELLIWKATEDNLSFVDTADFVRNQGNSGAGTNTIPVTNLVIEERGTRPHFHWDLGFRLGVNYQLPCQKWGVGIKWTHFNTTGTNEEKSDFQVGDHFALTGKVLIPKWSAFFNRPGATDAPFIPDVARMRWGLHLNLVDIDLFRECKPCLCCSITPFVGVRIAHVKQRFDVHYSAHRNLNININGVVNDFSEINEMHNAFFAAGPRTGFSTNYEMGCGWSIFASGAVTVAWGNFEIQQVDQMSIFVDPNGNPTGRPTIKDKLRVKDHFLACRAITDASLGLQWKHCLKNGYLISLRLVYENHLFFGQNMLQKYANFGSSAKTQQLIIPYTLQNIAVEGAEIHRSPGIRGDLCVQGITITGRLDF